MERQEKLKLPPIVQAARDGQADRLLAMISYYGAGFSLWGRRSRLLESTDASGRTALMWGALRGHSAVCGVLLAAGAKADHPDTRGRTALYLAAQNGHTAIVSLLLNSGAKLITTQGRSTPLMAACVNGHEAVVDVLLALPKDKSINMDAKDQYGQTALFMAAGRGRVAIVRKLLNLGADWSVVDGEGQRAVDRAAEGGYTQCCELLQEAEHAHLTRLMTSIGTRRGSRDLLLKGLASLRPNEPGDQRV